MDEQEFTFQLEIRVDDHETLTRRLLEARERLTAQDASAMIEGLRQEVESRFRLSWDLDQGRLAGEVTIQVPADYDLEDPLTEESVVVNHQEGVAADFEAMIVERIALTRDDPAN